MTTYAVDVTDFALARHSEDQGGYRRTGARVVSTDACGRDLRVVAEGVDYLYPQEHRREGPWVGCDEGTRELFAFEPQGRLGFPRICGHLG